MKMLLGRANMLDFPLELFNELAEPNTLHKLKLQLAHSCHILFQVNPGQSITQYQTLEVWERNDAQTGIPSGIPEGAMCVQRFDDSRKSAIHNTYRNSLRSSSLREPRDPLLKVLNILILLKIFMTNGLKKE